MYSLGIEAFLEVIRSGNLIRAAQHLHLSQSTVSHRLEELEKEVGGLLIDRRRGLRSIHLTPVGERFLAIAERWESLIQEIHQFRGGVPLSLSIGSVDSVNAFVLPPVYRLLRQRAPMMQIQLRTQQSTELYAMIEHREIDVAFVLHERFVPNVVLKSFFVEPLVFIQPASGRELPEYIDPRTLEPRSELYINWSPLFQSWHDQWWGSRGSPLIVLDTAQLIMAFMNSSELWSIVPLSMARAFVSTAKFNMARLTDPPPERICYWIEHKFPRVGSEQGLTLLADCSQRARELPDMTAFLPQVPNELAGDAKG